MLATQDIRSNTGTEKVRIKLCLTLLFRTHILRSQHSPEKELKAFAKVHLEPGECKTLTLSIRREALAYYDDLAHEWVAEAGEFEVLVGSSSQEIRARAMFALTTSSHWHS